MQTVGNAPASTMRSMPRFVASAGSGPAMISPETRPGPSRAAVYYMASKKPSWPSVCAFPGQSRANVSGSSNS